jgi:hypothetical protein
LRRSSLGNRGTRIKELRAVELFDVGGSFFCFTPTLLCRFPIVGYGGC